MVLALPPAPPAFHYCTVPIATIADKGRHVVTALFPRRLRWQRARAGWPRPDPPLIPLCCLLAHLHIDVAHWLPNMPRGSEDQQRAGVRDTNADACGRMKKHHPGPIHFNGRP